MAFHPLYIRREERHAMWYDGAGQLLRVLLVGAGGYAALVVVLRLAGKRTLAKLNAFDLVVTVALGSLLATILLSSSVSYAEGLTGLCLIVGLQAFASFLSTRVQLIARLIRSRPVLLMADGVMRADVMRGERVLAEELRQAIRSSGYGASDRVAAVVLETDGTLSVITADSVGSGDALTGVAGWEGGDLTDASGAPTDEPRRSCPR